MCSVKKTELGQTSRNYFVDLSSRKYLRNDCIYMVEQFNYDILQEGTRVYSASFGLVSRNSCKILEKKIEKNCEFQLKVSPKTLICEFGPKKTRILKFEFWNFLKKCAEFFC